MAKVGDRVEVNTKSGTRLGQVVRVSGSLLRLRWENGEETTLVPGPGALRVISGQPAKRAAAKKAPAKRAATTKKAAPKKAAPKKAASKKPAARKKGKR